MGQQSDGYGYFLGSGPVAFGSALAVRTVISQDRVIDRAIEELVQHLVDLKFAVKFDDAVGKSLLAEEMPQIIAGEHQGPDQVLEAYSLRCASGGDSREAAGYISLGFLQQPFSQIAKNLGDGPLQFRGSNLTKIRSTLGGANLLRQSTRQFVAVPFDQAHQFHPQHLPFPLFYI